MAEKKTSAAVETPEVTTPAEEEVELNESVTAEGHEPETPEQEEAQESEIPAPPVGRAAVETPEVTTPALNQPAVAPLSDEQAHDDQDVQDVILFYQLAEKLPDAEQEGLFAAIHGHMAATGRDPEHRTSAIIGSVVDAVIKDQEMRDHVYSVAEKLTRAQLQEAFSHINGIFIQNGRTNASKVAGIAQAIDEIFGADA